MLNGLRYIVFIGSILLLSVNGMAQELWLKAETLPATYNDYDSISVWNDQSGNGHNATQSGTKRPILTYGSNGNRAIFFWNTFLDIPYSSSLNPSSFTVFLAMRGSNTSGFSSPYTSRDDNPSKGYILYLNGGEFRYWSGGGASTGDWHAFNTGVQTEGSRFELITFKGSASGSNIVKRFYKNGTMASSTPTHSYSPNTQRPTRLGAGASETANGDFFLSGYISEVIMYPSALGDTDREKVESYLGVKYGLTLSHNYQSSGGTTTYWVNTYGNDITGLGRDNTYGLHQKYATSVDYSPSLSMGFALSTDTNFESYSSSARPDLSNNQFLIMGHNDGAYNAWINEGSYKRIGRRWKVRNTGSTGSINIQFYMNGVVDATGSRKIAVDNDEDLSNGIVAMYSLTSVGSSYFRTAIPFPDGTSYMTVIDDIQPEQQLWLKADAGTSTTTDNQTVQSWSSQHGGSITATQSADNARATYQDNEINFNPVLQFDGSNDFMQIFGSPPLGYGNASRATFLVANKNSSSSWKFAFSYGTGSSLQAWCLGANSNSIVLGSWGNDIITSSWGTDSRLITGTHNGSTMELYGEGNSLGTRSETLNTESSPATIHIGAQVNRVENWPGQIAEILHYSGNLQESERQQIQTYLALKYGITLNHNYVSSGGTTVYPMQSYTLYDIAGIGSDSTYGLDQRISSTENSTSSDNADLTIATTNDFTSSNLNSGRSSLSNNQFLVWGRRNFSTSSWIVDNSYRRVQEYWKVENTGNVGTIHMQINLKDFPDSWTGTYYAIVDADADLSSGAQTYALTNSSGDLYTASFQFPSGTSYLSIGFESAGVDYGDAPNSYSTLSSSSGPYHNIVTGTYLGAGVSADSDGFGNGTDSGGDASDDTNDDGVTFNPSLNISGANIIEAGVTNTIRVNASVAGYVTAWLDLNLDGDFLDSGEKIIDNSSVSVGNTDLTFSVANTNKHGVTYARIRYYTTSGQVTLPTGLATSGEVEDYQVNIVADRPSDICSNLIINGGFESPNISGSYSQANTSTIPGWNSSVNKVEIWNSGSVSGIPSQEGGQLAELNVDGSTTYYQDVVTNPGETMTWQIYHRGRGGSEQIAFKLGPPGSTSTIQNITTGTTWTQYTGTYTIPSGQNVTRFEISTVSPTGGSGNLLDNIRFYVVDNTNPTITCASNQSVNPNNASCTFLVSGTAWDATATDNCVTVTLAHDYDGGGSSLNGKSFPVGTTTVTWTATDGSSNTATCTMNITVANNLSAAIASDSGTEICSGDQVIYTATPTNGATPFTYNFRVGGTSVQSGSGTTYTTTSLSNNNVVDVIITDTNGCTATSSSLTMTVRGAITTNAIQIEN
ncbi:HYR domain-containing protein [Prolixibacteraceae bacterium JC049]|nr:HYR domain-containing protein [Prolixibacteraceae bacterium JC049]